MERKKEIKKDEVILYFYYYFWRVQKLFNDSATPKEKITHQHL